MLIESVGLTNNLARLLAACNSVSYLLFSLIGIPNVERWGRRKMMMYAAAGQFFCYCIITICIRYNEMDSLPITTQQSWAKASIGFFFLYYVFFGIGWQGVPWLYPTEINSMAMRTKGAALGTATNWFVVHRTNNLRNMLTSDLGSLTSWSSKSHRPASSPYTGSSTSSGPCSTLLSYRLVYILACLPPFTSAY